MDDTIDGNFNKKSLFYNGWGVRFVLIFIFLFNIIFSLLSPVLSALIMGVKIDEARQLLNTPDGTALAINLTRINHVISFLGYMFVPALLFAVVNRKSLIEEGGLRTRVQPREAGMSLLLTITAFAPVNWLDGFMRSIQWPQKVSFIATKLDTLRQEATGTILDMQVPTELLVCLLIVALMPAVFEELLFRGVLLNIHKGLNGSLRWAVINQAIIFAALHFSFYELPGILLMGVALGVVAAATGTIIYTIGIHFLFNATAVILHYISQQHFQQTGVNGAFDNINIPGYMALLSAIPFVYSLFWFKRRKREIQNV
jgi:hypothetical protein